MSYHDSHEDLEPPSYLLNPRLLAGTSPGIRKLLGIKLTITIQVLSVTVETKPTAKGSYQMAEVAYKNLTFQGKVESKKLMSFGAGVAAFTLLSKAEGGSKWDITVVKNDKGFNDWTGAAPSTGDTPVQPSTPAPAASKAGAYTPTTKSTYETPEERAARQILIVRQSSLSAAVNNLSTGSKTPAKSADVIAQAKEFEAYVFGREDGEAKDTGLSTGSGFDDMNDDVPL